MSCGLKGKRALVTGGASGIGLAVVKKFLEEEALVFIFDKNLTPYDIQSQTVNYTVDITNKHALAGCTHHILVTSGLDILVNCAGIDLPLDLTNFKWLDWEAVLETNLSAPAFISAKVATHMKERGVKGSIINIASVHIRQAFPGGAAYDASKHGLVGFSRVLALEFGPYGIRCNTVDPGFTYPTGITGELSPETVADFSSRIPLGKPTTPEDVAEVVAFLASDKAPNITGASIPVDGGLPIKSALF